MMGDLAAISPVDFFRISYCAVLALTLGLSWRRHYEYQQLPGVRIIRLRFLGRWPIPLVGPLAFRVTGLILIGCLIAAAAGWYPLVTLAGALGAYFLYFGQIISLSEVSRKTHTIPVILTILWVWHFGADNEPSRLLWPIVMIKLVVAQVYFSSALVKLRHAGWRWGDGVSLRFHLVKSHLLYGRTAADWISNRVSLCRLLSVGVLVFELSFWLTALYPVLGWFYVPAALCFHEGTRRVMRINYLKFLGPAYLVFVAEAWGAMS